MRIKCPWCGDRPREEFSYLGDATVRRPDGADREDPKAWQDYVYLRDNPAGQKFLSRLEKKHDKGKALTILAHKLARAVYYMLKRKVAFDMQRFLND